MKERFLVNPPAPLPPGPYRLRLTLAHADHPPDTTVLGLIYVAEDRGEFLGTLWWPDWVPLLSAANGPREGSP